MRKSIFAVSLLAAALVSPLAHAYKEGDVIVRAGAAVVDPNSDSSGLTNSALGSLPGDVTVGSDTQLGLTFAYMLQDHLGLELLAATPFTHEVKMKNSTNGVVGNALDGKIGDVSHLPPTLSLQYYPMDPASKFQPYAGIGLNYTVFFDEDLSSQYEALGATDLNLDSSWGVSGQLGADYLITDNILLNAAVWYIDIDTTATIDANSNGLPLSGTKTKVDVSIDPWVYMVGVGYKF
jgi:outer membrane protein